MLLSRPLGLVYALMEVWIMLAFIELRIKTPFYHVFPSL